MLAAAAASAEAEWSFGTPVNLGPLVNSSAGGTILCYAANRPGGSGGTDVWRVPLISTAPAR